MKKIVVINHKMNLSYDDVMQYINDIKNKISDVFDVVFCPTSIYLYLFKASGYKLGTQNLFYLDKGPYTGEISPSQLKSIGVDYAIIGHSDRRINFHEDDDLIAKKLVASIQNNIKPILCVGETREEKDLKKTVSVLKNQLLTDLSKLNKEDISNITIAYEPIWAISKGITNSSGVLENPITPTTNEIEDAINNIKDIIVRQYNLDIRVIYGGSVDEGNISDVMNIKNIDGILIGGASLNSKHLIKILDIVD